MNLYVWPHVFVHIYNVLGLTLNFSAVVLAVCFLCAVYRYFLAEWIDE